MWTWQILLTVLLFSALVVHPRCVVLNYGADPHL